MHPILIAIMFVAGQQPVVVDVGQPSPIAGIVVPEARAREIVEEEAELSALRARLADSQHETIAVEQLWRARCQEQAQAKKDASWLTDPSVVGWVSFVAGVTVGAGVILGGAWAAQAVAGK